LGKSIRRYFLVAACCLSTIGSAQSAVAVPPKLIVVIAIDQMRSDFLDRFAPLYKSGLKTLIERGAVFTG
jgi:predicted AlkP superfamily pyrophosphatase or phosphodiesterase